MNKSKLNDVDDYIATFPEETRLILEEIRSVIRKSAPDASERR